MLKSDVGRRSASVLTAALMLLAATSVHALAGNDPKEQSTGTIVRRSVAEPIMAIVSLRGQKITIYDEDGRIMHAPVSSGQPSRETPAGIFSVIQKDANHHSNLYDDASMPHMQRLTWSGIALHGGPLPGHAASHGCVRLPYDFATRLFDVTRLGMRVIVAPGDVEPFPVVHPILFRLPPEKPDDTASRIAQAAEAAQNADRARRAVFAASRNFAQANMAVRRLRFLKDRLEQQLADTEISDPSQGSVELREAAATAKAKLSAKIADFENQLASAEDDLQPKAIALSDAQQAVAVEVTRADVAAAAANAATQGPVPVSIFVSRRTQRLYVRRAFQPVFDVPITLRDPDLPIGTYVFTALKPGEDAEDMQWSVVSLVGQDPKAGIGEFQHQSMEAPREDAREKGVKDALDRISIPEDAVNRITQLMSLRSSLIVSDEGPSSEIGTGTEFIVVLSDEPQGGLTSRRRSLATDARYAPRHRRPLWRSSF